MSFTIRKFNDAERLGDKLKALRKELNFTLSDMARLTKINRKYLRLLEDNLFEKLPDPVYTRNFVKIYLRVLGANEAYYLNLFEQERGTCDFTDHSRMPRERARAIRFLVASRYVKIALFVLAAVSVMFYLGGQVRTIVTPPALYVFEPTDGFVTKQAAVIVTGSVKEDATVTVNGTKVLLDKEGAFEMEVALERGLNVIKIESVKRYSKTHTEYRRVILEQDRTITLAPRVDN
ncbi:helix-turn-helix domain-containing protein [Candidatus Parcubacteria bacterium]|nr:helix-turn-helix domain-containing protein [Candidatus Parcubacteria bacterium]